MSRVGTKEPAQVPGDISSLSDPYISQRRKSQFYGSRIHWQLSRLAPLRSGREFAMFIVNLGCGGGAGNFFAAQLPESFAEAGSGLAHGLFGLAEFVATTA